MLVGGIKKREFIQMDPVSAQLNNALVLNKKNRYSPIIEESVQEKIAETVNAKLDAGQKTVLIDEILFKRTIMCVRGRLVNYAGSECLKVKLSCSEKKYSFSIPHVDIADGTFKLSFNVMSLRSNLPLQNGQYSLEFHEIAECDEDAAEMARLGYVSTIVHDDNRRYKSYYTKDKYFVKAVLISEVQYAYLAPEYNLDYKYDKQNPSHWRMVKGSQNYFFADPTYDTKDYRYTLSVEYIVLPSLPISFWRERREERQAKKEERRKKRSSIKKDLLFYGYRILFNSLLRFAKKEGNVVLFASGSRAEIGGNEEIIYKAMLDRGMDKTHRFLFDFKPSITQKKNKIETVQFLYKLAIADVIMIDDYYPDIYRVDYPKDKKIVQVWHACGAFKALGLERLGKKGAPPFNTRVHRCYTHVPVSSYHSLLHHAEAFGIAEKNFYPIGIPRTDVFFDKSYIGETAARLKNEFPQTRGKSKIFLYAPTFRGENAKNAYFPFEKLDIFALGDFCVRTNSLMILKMHPFVTKKIRIPEEYRDYIVDATSYREVNDVLMMVDVVITDYSSVIYEFSLLDRPMLFYAFDQERYVATRDFYEPYEEIVPGKIVHTFAEMLECMETETYDYHKVAPFVRKNFTYTDGKATERFINHVILDEPYELKVDYSTIF